MGGIDIHPDQAIEPALGFVRQIVISADTVGEPGVPAAFGRLDAVEAGIGAGRIEIALVRMEPHLTVRQDAVFPDVGDMHHADDLAVVPVETDLRPRLEARSAGFDVDAMEMTRDETGIIISFISARVTLIRSAFAAANSWRPM